MSPTSRHPIFGTPINPKAKGRCLHDMKYRLVRMYDMAARDMEGIAVNWCDYCGTDLDEEAS